MTAKFPITSEIAGDLVGMALSELRLCKVTRSETVVVFSDTRTNSNYVSAFLAAGKELAGTIFQVMIPVLPDGQGGDFNLGPVLKILQESHFVVDLSTGEFLHLHRKWLKEVLSSGTRVLQVRASDDQLRRCFPTEELRRKTVKGAEWLERSKVIQITSKAGTDLRMSKAGRAAGTQYGISDVPGRWDSWPSGFLFCTAQEETGNGSLVLDVGDILVMLGRYVAEPVRIKVENGRIVSIDGGVDAMLLREHLDQSRDPEAFVISHIGWGTDHRARWTEVAQRGTEEGARDARSAYGNVQIAFGENYSLGGENKTHAHEDLVLRRATFELDGEIIVDNGDIVPQELR
jgi:2,5-dihydroxypyridine 5,6-dioxygenase